MSAEEAWQEHIAGEPYWYERRYPEVKAGFMAGYRRALEDAAKQGIAQKNRMCSCGHNLPEHLGGFAAGYYCRGCQRCKGFTEVRAAAADPRETKD